MGDPVVKRTGTRNLWGTLAFLAAIPLALLIYAVNKALPEQPERAVMVVGSLFVIVLLIAPAMYLLVQWRTVVASRLCLVVLATIGVVLTAIYLYWVSFYVSFPADILTWSESDFVNDTLKLHIGYPLYSAQANNESYTYTPAAQVLTYGLAWLFGRPFSVPTYRAIQLGFTLISAFIATLCCGELLARVNPGQKNEYDPLWNTIWLPFFFLIATNFLTNPFVYNLHGDSLAQALSVAAFWLLLRYTRTQNKKLLPLMAIIPSLGFLVKQSLAIWAVLYCIQLAVFEYPRSFKRLLAFGSATFGTLGIVLAASYLMWGHDFFYWTVDALSKHPISILRSFQHMLDIWPYFVIALLSAIVMLRGRNFRPLLGPWLIGMALLTAETYTSGAAWMRNHIGPGCLIASIWFITSLVRVWPTIDLGESQGASRVYLNAGIAVAALGLLYGGLGIVRIPLRPIPTDAYRYVNDIEKEFVSQPAKGVLLDVGTWVYTRDGVIMKDRAVSIGERGYTDTADFSGILQRLRQKSYSKILVRRLHSRDFWYDHYLWRHPSGIREALLQNYQEVGQIQGVRQIKVEEDTPYLFSDISILVPKQD
jgi:hypothetical protein